MYFLHNEINTIGKENKRDVVIKQKFEQESAVIREWNVVDVFVIPLPYSAGLRATAASCEYL
jgi:hypothetical protein